MRPEIQPLSPRHKKKEKHQLSFTAEITPAITQPPRRAESRLLQCLIPTEQSTSCLRWHFRLKDLTIRNLAALFLPFPPVWCCGARAKGRQRNAGLPAAEPLC